MDLLVRAAFKVVPLELIVSSIFWFVFYRWSSLSVSRLVLIQRNSKSGCYIDKTGVYHLVINKCVKAVTVDTLYVSEEQELL